MTTVSIHNVVRIEIGKAQPYSEGSAPGYWRTVTAYDTYGNHTKVTFHCEPSVEIVVE